MNAATLLYKTGADAALREEVVNRLSGPEFPQLQGVIVEVAAGIVTLRGSVKSFYARQLLVKGCKLVPHVAGVLDELQVVRSDRSRRPQLPE